HLCALRASAVPTQRIGAVEWSTASLFGRRIRIADLVRSIDAAGRAVSLRHLVLRGKLDRGAERHRVTREAQGERRKAHVGPSLDVLVSQAEQQRIGDLPRETDVGEKRV